MVDRQSRDALATLTQAFLEGRVTGPDLLRAARNLERSAASGELDPAVEAVSERLHACLALFDGAGHSVSDRGGPEFADQLEPRDWDCFVRCAAFLRGDGEIAWPRVDWAAPDPTTHPPDLLVIAIILAAGASGTATVMLLALGYWRLALLAAGATVFLGCHARNRTRRALQPTVSDRGDPSAFPFTTQVEVTDAFSRLANEGVSLPALRGEVDRGAPHAPWNPPSP
ncbi:MAG TPA: hypothetical protein QGH10_06315 [Armatimonadota bacterium]|nr:hypothetical protein [Armatimonadota bacterium]